MSALRVGTYITAGIEAGQIGRKGKATYVTDRLRRRKRQSFLLRRAFLATAQPWNRLDIARSCLKDRSAFMERCSQPAAPPLYTNWGYFLAFFFIF